MYLVQLICDPNQPSTEAAFLIETDAQAWVKTQKQTFPMLQYRIIKSEQYLHNMTPAKED